MIWYNNTYESHSNPSSASSAETGRVATSYDKKRRLVFGAFYMNKTNKRN